MPDRMANFGLTVKDLQDALKDQNRESAAGELGKQPIEGLDITIPIIAQGRLSTVNEFEEIVVRANPDGSIIRLRDVARVSLEASSYSTESGKVWSMRFLLILLRIFLNLSMRYIKLC